MRGNKVADWMTPDPITVTPTVTLDVAHQLMKENGFRHLPVVSGRRLVSLIEKSDIRRSELSVAAVYGRSEMSSVISRLKTVGEIMSYSPPTIGADEMVSTAAQRLLDQHLTALPVVDEQDHLLGIITESDLFRLIVETQLTAEQQNG